MQQSIIRVLESPYAVRAAMAVTLALGYVFIFVWAPHPWSWQGIDSYHELAKALARGEAFPTTDVPWGYTQYAAFLYRVFGERIWVPLFVQATLNALVPWLLYRLVAPLAGRRVATLSAIIAGLFSFNTVYASTQSSDAICTVLFLLGLLAFARGVGNSDTRAFAVSGVLFGLVPQFRPNLVLLPIVLAAGYLLKRPLRGAIARAAVFLALVAALQMPWVIRNYRLTGLFLPTSTHGGVQLWYGSLQVGPFLESRAHNPRFYFATPALPYTSMWHRPIVITAGYRDCGDQHVPTQLVYWTDRDPSHQVVAPQAGWSDGGMSSYIVPAQQKDTTLYYLFEQRAADGTVATAPIGGDTDPMVAFISDRHLEDLDQRDDLLDMFDLVRMLRHIAWHEPLRAEAKLDLTRDGVIDAADIEALAQIQLGGMAGRFPKPATRIESDGQSVALRLADGSWLRIPRQFGGRQTDVALSLDGEMAPELVSRNRTFTSLAHRDVPTRCLPAAEATFNMPFYLAEPHMMRRFMALALDNIERDRLGFAAASLYRAMRLFIVRGSDDLSTTQQFRGSTVVYGLGTALSIAYFAVFSAGVFVAWRRRSPLLVFLVPIVYVPATICVVLTNMRYTVTVQPLMFAFIAMALAASLGLDEPTDETDAGWSHP